MSMEPIADELLHFIHAAFETLDQLRILLLLRASPERTWYPAAISSYLHTQPDVVVSSLDMLCRKGRAGFFLSRGAITISSIRFNPWPKARASRQYHTTRATTCGLSAVEPGKRRLDDDSPILQSHLMLVSQIAVARHLRNRPDPNRHKAILWCNRLRLSLAQGGSDRLPDDDDRLNREGE